LQAGGPFERRTSSLLTKRLLCDLEAVNPTALSPTATLTRGALCCVGLVKRFDERPVVNGVGFAIAPGETYGLLGPNGAGKTTTISMICGLLRRDAGEITIAGRALDDNPMEAKAAIGYVPQDVALYPDLTGGENLRFFGSLYGLRGKDLARRVGHTLEVVGLSDRAEDRVDDYSGGMKRRLNIAAGLLHEPHLLVLDEPTVGVDPQSRNAILEAVTQLGSRGMAVLYTTHYMEEAERLCDRVGILDEGRLVAEGTRAELVAMVGERDHIRLSALGALASFAEACRSMNDVAEANVTDGGVDLLVSGARRLLPQVIEQAECSGTAIQSVEVDEPNLETVFLHLTGKALRD
jgi:ABC-2 type transport system ATP-binding protein